MTAVFTDHFRAQLFANLTLMAGKQIEIVYFSGYAAFSGPNDPRYTALTNLASLSNVLGWSAPLTPTTAHTVSTSDNGNNRYVIDSNPHVNQAGWADTRVVAAAVILKGGPYGGVTNPIIFVTDSPFQGGTVMRQGDSLVALPAANIGNLAWLFGWQTPAAGATQVLPTEGTLSILKAPPSYEYSHQQHCWLFPQRVNLLANPSFEGGTNHWRTNRALTRQAGGAPGGGVWEARVTGAAKLILESNTFPTYGPIAADNWTVQAMIRGTGKVRIGLVSWESDFATTAVDWGPDTEVWDLPASGWLHVYALRHVREASTGMLRIECDGTDMYLDNLLCEPEWLPGWPYFDGDTKYGALDDFSWYGGANRKGSTYSLWYNHRRAVVGRLFAWNISDDDFTVTDEEVESQGYVYKWVPAGVRVIPHMDVLSVDDPQSPIPAVTGSVLPYDGAGGVRYPWPPSALSFPGTSGKYVSTPDAAAFDITGDLCIIAKVTPTNWAGIGSIVSKWSGVQCSYQLYLASLGTLGLMWSANGSNAVSQQSIGGFSVTATPWVAATLDVDNGNDGSDVKFWSSLDGVTWKQMGTPSSQSITSVFPSTTPVNIGANTGGTANLFNGLIQDVRIYNGIGNNTAPGLGTLVGHFDAARPWAGATYTDETGKVWTNNGSLSFVA